MSHARYHALLVEINKTDHWLWSGFDEKVKDFSDPYYYLLVTGTTDWISYNSVKPGPTLLTGIHNYIFDLSYLTLKGCAATLDSQNIIVASVSSELGVSNYNFITGQSLHISNLRHSRIKPGCAILENQNGAKLFVVIGGRGNHAGHVELLDLNNTNPQMELGTCL